MADKKNFLDEFLEPVDDAIHMLFDIAAPVVAPEVKDDGRTGKRKTEGGEAGGGKEGGIASGLASIVKPAAKSGSTPDPDGKKDEGGGAKE